MDRRDALTTGALMLVLCLVVSAIVVTRRDPFSGDAVNAATSTTTTPEPENTADTAEIEAFVDEAMAFIENLRGAPFVERPDVVVLADRDFEARLDRDIAEDFAADPDELVELNALYRATGLIETDDSVDEVARRFGAAGVLGFYDPETDELVVRAGDGLSLLTRSTIVHELVHAYDDQRFDLDRPEYADDPSTELAWTFRAVAEGSASWVEEAWKATLPAVDRGRLLEEELAFGDPDLLRQFTLALLVLELSPYEAGEPFVAGLVAADGTDALDAVLADPPPTSEQVLEPDRFAVGEPAIAVTAPPADGDALWSGVGGQVLVDALFTGSFIGADISWGGDQMVVWVDDVGRSCLRWDLVADTEPGLGELRAGFERWGDAVGSTSVLSLDGTTVRVERCA